MITDRNGQLPYIKFAHQNNKGLASTRNAGISLSEGEIIALINQDDKAKAGNNRFRAYSSTSFISESLKTKAGFLNFNIIGKTVMALAYRVNQATNYKNSKTSFR